MTNLFLMDFKIIILIWKNIFLFIIRNKIYLILSGAKKLLVVAQYVFLFFWEYFFGKKVLQK